MHSILDGNTLDRLTKFKAYPAGWYGRDIGEALSIDTVMLFEEFAKSLGTLHTSPSLFLTIDGHLQLAWEDINDNGFEITVYSDKFEYYFESDNSEGFFDEVDMQLLINKIKEC
jgi:hypothetical protein